jgi:hypothetical protein
MVLTTGLLIVALLPVVIVMSVHTLRDSPAWQRRHFITMRVANWLGLMLAIAAILVSVPADSHYVLMVYPMWAIISAMCFLAHATEVGMYFVVGAFLCVAAIIMALTPTWAPLEVAVFITINAIGQGIYLRRLSSQRLEPSHPGLGSAPTTVKTKALG